MLRLHPRFVASAAARAAKAVVEYLSYNSLPPEDAGKVTLVGVHARLGDYDRHLRLFKIEPMDLQGYLGRAFNYLRETSTVNTCRLLYS